MRGIPTVTICTDEFSPLGHHEAESLGMPALPIALISHPLGGQKTEAVRQKAEAVLEQVVSILTTPQTELIHQSLGQG
jgi:hypothetical protein